jgi:hypothetical protein
MSLGTLLATTPETRRARRGRPVVSEDPGERERHIQCALYRLAQRKTVVQTARAFDVSERTVHYWVRLALSYNDPRCNFLRRLAGKG